MYFFPSKTSVKRDLKNARCFAVPFFTVVKSVHLTPIGALSLSGWLALPVVSFRFFECMSNAVDVKSHSVDVKLHSVEVESHRCRRLIWSSESQRLPVLF